MKTAPLGFMRECLAYDPETGSLTWKKRPRDHFGTARAWKNWNARFAGKEAGCIYISTGYRIVVLGRYGHIGAHRIAVALIDGVWPQFVDHRNGDPLDNRAENLRACTKAENCRNRRRNAANRSGFKGVSHPPRTSRWQARIQVNHVQRNLGMFDTPELAHAAYKRAAAKHHGSFANAG